MKILFVVKNLRISNGVSSYVMNYYRKLKQLDYKMDFLIINDTESPYYDEINQNGDSIYILPSYKKNIFLVIKFLLSLFDNNYDIIHSNVVNSGSLILFLAKLKKIKVRILHSHATQVGDSLFKRIRNIPFKIMAVCCSNSFFACSKLAGQDLFKKKKFYVINNAVDIDKFKYNEQHVQSLSKLYNLDSKYTILTVGRITKQKNPYFIVDIMDELVKIDNNYKLIWLGSGDMDLEIKEYIKNKNLNDNILLLGSVKNVNEFYSLSKIFILPSFYEGLPVVGIEAQISGIYCFFSDKITKEVALSNVNCEFLSIDSSKVWANKIIDLEYERKVNIDSIDYSDYIIDNQAFKLDKLYKELIEKNGKKYEK